MSAYGNAASHYLSAKRRDPVKVLMEEVVSHRVFARAVERLGLPPGAPLRVLDIGAGTGDGLALLRDRHGEPAPASAGRPVAYLGLDLDPGMVDTARSLHPEPGVRFEVGDVRRALPDEEFDLYLSCGVPYSHLRADEARGAIAGILRQAAARGRRAAVVVDVLGRYSVEWTPRWGQSRWNYAMTFFEDVDAPMEDLMTLYDRESLGALLAEAADEAGVTGYGVDFADRSVLVGRHTATRSFNPAIPPYRTLVNALSRGEETDVAELRFAAPREGAPAAVLEFFRDWEHTWNGLVDKALADGPTAAGPRARRLALDLLAVELHTPRGLGTGHSLTATLVLDPA